MWPRPGVLRTTRMIASHEGDAAGNVRTVEVDFPSEVRYIEDVIRLVVDECADVGFPPRILALNVPVVMAEALSNAVLRGNHEDPGKKVHVRTSVHAECLVIEVRDQGPGFDLDACLADPTTPENLDREDGRGLFLMQKLSDRIERFSLDEGNVVRITINRR